MSSDKSLNLSVYASDVLRLNVAIPTHMYKWSPKVLTLWGARSYTLAFSSSIYKCSKGLLLFSHLVMSDSLRPLAGCQASLSTTNSRSLLKPMPIELVMPSNHLILCCPLLILPSIFPSTRVFSNESVLHIRWPKYWHFSFSISPSSEYSGLTFFMIDWLDLLAVQGTLKSLLQHQSSKASTLYQILIYKYISALWLSFSFS